MIPPVLEAQKVTPVVTSLRPKAGGFLKLNLGGRDRPIEGFLTVDLYGGDQVDIQADCSSLDMVKSDTVEEIYASHILEHWPHTQTPAVLKEWLRVLKPGGKLFVSVPDFDAAVALYSKYGMTDFLRNLLYGDQIYDLAFHYTSFTFASLAAIVNKVGFSDVRRLQSMPYGVADCSANIDTNTGRQISVHAECLK